MKSLLAWALCGYQEQTKLLTKTQILERNMTIFIPSCQVTYGMTNSCKGVCDKYRATLPPNKIRYRSGQKYCSVCSCFFIIEDIRCPCCRTKLRTRPRTRRCKKIWLKEVEVLD